MDGEDAMILDRNLNSFASRMKVINANTQRLAEFLDGHPKVKQVHYPGLAGHPDYEISKRYLRSAGCLLSFVLAGDPQTTTPQFYDHLETPIIKAPSLGSAQTLLCLYTMLTHYFDPPEKLAQMGLDKYLIRISVGMEPFEELIHAFEKAFEQVTPEH